MLRIAPVGMTMGGALQAKSWPLYAIPSEAQPSFCHFDRSTAQSRNPAVVQYQSYQAAASIMQEYSNSAISLRTSFIHLDSLFRAIIIGSSPKYYRISNLTPFSLALYHFYIYALFAGLLSVFFVL
jgi:hypothetical protein